MRVLEQLTTPDSISLSLPTLTPLYTGGVGQQGDQLHPSSLLGGVRRFSCLLAAAVGDATFEEAVWGTAADDEGPRHAKRVALSLDTRELHTVSLASRIRWQDGAHQHRGWFYNTAWQGVLSLGVARRGVSDAHWQLLLLALRILVRHATLGARDQWGLGVADCPELPTVSPLRAVSGPPLRGPGLHRAFFAEVRFPCAPPQDADLHHALEAGLRWRAALRSSLRCTGDSADLRHYVYGELNRWGGAVNVSAVYPTGTGRSALRVWGVFPHTEPARFEGERALVLQRMREVLQRGLAEPRPCRHEPSFAWEDGAAQEDLVAWINHLAGVSP